MAKKVPLTTTVRARIPEKIAMKMSVYAKKHGCNGSTIIRNALKIFLHNVSTKSLETATETTK